MDSKVIEIEFKPEKETKNTVKFQEQVPAGRMVEYVGTLYVQKHTLQEIGWSEGRVLRVSLMV